MRVPASRSVAVRELVLSALADGRSELDLGDIDPGDDVAAMCDALAALGYHLDGGPSGVVGLVGAGRSIPVGKGAVDVRDADAVVGFVTALAATLPGRTRIDGSQRLRRRPIGLLVSALRKLGAEIEGDALPLSVSGPLRGGRAEVSGHGSSEVVSALLLVAPLAERGIELRVSGTAFPAPPIDLTLAALEGRGVKVERMAATNTFWMGPQTVRSRAVAIPGDVTAAGYPAAAAAILGGRVTIENVDPHRPVGAQGDLRAFDVLEAMGCRVSRFFGGITVRRTGPLYGVREDARDIWEVFPALAVVAACAQGRSEILGLGHARQQGSDPVAAVAAGLGALGGRATVYSDGLAIEPAPLHGGVIEADGDHRVAMAFAILGLQVPGVAIEGAEAASRAFPGFYGLLSELAG